eukprot:233518_1
MSNQTFFDHNILKEGWLQKQSRYLHHWRKRWVVLTLNALYTFENHKQYQNPTEVINVTDISSITSPNERQNQFVIKTKGNISFTFQGSLSMVISQWINTIVGYINQISIPISVDCKRVNNYSDQFELHIPYHMNYDYKINQIVQDIIQHIDEKHKPVKFKPILIFSSSFIGQ